MPHQWCTLSKLAIQGSIHDTTIPMSFLLILFFQIIIHLKNIIHNIVNNILSASRVCASLICSGGICLAGISSRGNCPEG